MNIGGLPIVVGFFDLISELRTWLGETFDLDRQKVHELDEEL